MTTMKTKNNNKTFSTAEIFDAHTIFPTKHFENIVQLEAMSEKDVTELFEGLILSASDYYTREATQKLAKAIKSGSRVMTYFTILNALSDVTVSLNATQSSASESIYDYKMVEAFEGRGYQVVDTSEVDYMIGDFEEQYVGKFN